MADEGNGESSSRAKLIEEIREIQNKLVFYGVKRDFIDFNRRNDLQIAEELEARREQLQRRKKFLGEKE